MITRNTACIFAVLVLAASAADAAPAQIRSERLISAGRWNCIDWAGKKRGGIERDAIQWILGYISAKIDGDPRERKFLGSEQALIEARDFCRANPDSSLDEVALHIFALALDRGSPRR